MDLTNKKFGEWLALYSLKKNGRIYWHCKCDCGEERDVLQYSLTSGKSTGCGHNKKKGHYKLDLTGQKFGSLTAIKPTDKRDNNAIVWLCKCDCGNFVEWDTGRLKQTKNPNCGCLKDLTGQRFGKIVIQKRVQNLRKNSRDIIWQYKCDCGNCSTASGTDLRQGKVLSCGCIKSIGEQNIINCLNKNNIIYKKEYVFNDLKDKNYLRYDFAIFDKNNNLIRLIEFDGNQHYDKNNSFYSESTKKHDLMKNEYAKKNNIPLVRIPYKERDNINLDIILGDKYLL